jgi:hypothetical protein
MATLEARARGEVRASDAERESCALALRHHYEQGRLDADELEERLGQAARARTRGDLRALTRDLPRPSRRTRRERRALHGLRVHATVYTAVNSGMVALWAASGMGGFWPAGVLAPWGIGLGWHALAVRLGQRRRRALPR